MHAALAIDHGHLHRICCHARCNSQFRAWRDDHVTLFRRGHVWYPYHFDIPFTRRARFNLTVFLAVGFGATLVPNWSKEALESPDSTFSFEDKT